MTQIKKHLLWTFLLLVPVLTLIIKKVSADYGDLNVNGVISAQRTKISSNTATASWGFQNGSTFSTSGNGPLVLNSSMTISPIGSFSIANGSFSVLGFSTFTAIVTSVTFRGNGGVQGTTVTLGGIQFVNNPDRDAVFPIQQYPGFELIAATQPNVATATLTLVCSTRSWAFAVFYGSPTGAEGGDTHIAFGNAPYSAGLYSVMRTTVAVGLVTVPTSSVTAIGIPVFGDTTSSAAARMSIIYVLNNDLATPKIGFINSVSITTNTEAPIAATTNFGWFSANERVDRISVTMVRPGKKFCEGSKWKLGSYLAVYGNTFGRKD